MSIQQRPISMIEGLAAIASVLVLAGWHSLRSRYGAWKALPVITAPLNPFARARS
jgi:hypothetical protein